MLFSMTRPRHDWLAVMAGTFALAAAVSAGDAWAQGPGPRTAARPAAKPADPKARELLGEVAKAYRGLDSYADEGKFVVAMTLAGKPQNQKLPLKFTFVRPNKLDLDAGPVRLTSDGKTLTTSVLPLKRYTTAPSPEKIGFETFQEGPVGAVLFGGPTGVPMFVLVNLLTAPDAPAALGQLGGSLQLAPDDPKAGAAKHPALLIDQQEGPDIRMEVDPATKLLSRIDLQIDPSDLEKSAKAGQAVTIEQFGWTSGAVSTQVQKERSFAYEPPKGFTKVDSLQERPAGGEEQKFAASAHLGKPAPDFTLTVLDGPDKTRTVTKAELAGKVVVLDFWATWCPPCLAELPEIQKLVEALAKDKKDVVVVALSQDSEPKELSEVRKLVEETLKDKKITLTGNPVGLIALDPSGSVGQAFEAEAFPTLVVLDGKGTVQSVHVGFRPDIREQLASEIDSLLAGKSLVKGTDQAKEAAGKPGAARGQK
jgi:thiol-disulfide isomerase/thioredoxin